LLRSLLVCVLASVVLTAPAAAQEQPSVPLQVGDSWTYRLFDPLTNLDRGTAKETVGSVDEKGAWVLQERKAGRRWLRWDNVRAWFTEIHAFDEQSPTKRGGQRYEADASEGLRLPLTVGARWKQVEPWYSAKSQGRDELEYRVVSQEPVTSSSPATCRTRYGARTEPPA